MASNPFVRLCAFALVVSGVFWFVGDLTHLGLDADASETERTLSTWGYAHGFTEFAGAFFLALGFPGLLIYNMRRVGGLGLGVLVVTQVFTLLLVGAFFVVGFVNPALAQVAPQAMDQEPPAVLAAPFIAAFMGGSLMLLVLGITLALRGRTTRGPALMFTVGALAIIVANVLPAIGTGAGVLLGIGVASLGIDIVRHEHDTTLDTVPDAAIAI